MFIRKAADDFSTLSESLRLRSSFDSAAPLISQHLERVQELLNDFIRIDPFVDQSMASALTTSCGIKLNYQSSIHNTGKPGIGGYTYEVAVHHLERIETGLGIIAKVSSSALSMKTPLAEVSP